MEDQLWCQACFMDEWRMHAIGYIHSPYRETKQIPKGLGAAHVAEGVLELMPKYEAGLQDIEGFSLLF